MSGQIRVWAFLLVSMVCTPAFALPQAPHSMEVNNISCSDCHVPFGGLLGAQAGVADSGTDVLLVHPEQGWVVDQWVGGVIVFTSGENNGLYRRIVSNDGETIFWAGPLPALVATGDQYTLGKTTEYDVAFKCKTCHNLGGQASTMPNVALHVVDGGAQVIGCGKCHEPHNVEPNSGVGQRLIRRSVRWPTARTPVDFPAGGANPLVDDAPPYSGICEVCHTQTSVYRNDGSGAAHQTGTCSTCHQHDNTFMDTGSVEANCTDVVDNDSDGATDCADSDCNNPPVAHAGGPYEAPYGGSVILDASASFDSAAPCPGTITTYEWDLDNDGTFDLTAATATHVATFALLESYGIATDGTANTIRLRITDDFGATATADALLIIFPQGIWDVSLWDSATWQ